MDQSQLDKFEQSAIKLEVEENEAHWNERLTEVAKAKSTPEKPK